MDLSKAFDTINYSLLLAKLVTYRFSRTSLNLKQNYFCNRQQRIPINGSFSDWTEVIRGVSQDSILIPLLFNVFLNYIFMFTLKCKNKYFVIMPMSTLCILLKKDLNQIKKTLKWGQSIRYLSRQ